MFCLQAVDTLPPIAARVGRDGRQQAVQGFLYVGAQIEWSYYWVCSPDGAYVGSDDKMRCRGDNIT